jgi:predicted TIM-barrel fold metal-dependent hydrolase
MSYIDAHVHVWTPDRAAWPRPRDFAPVEPARFTPEDLLALATPVKVDRIVLIQMSFYGFDNAYMLDAIARRPKVFRGVAVVDHDAAGVAAEMRRVKALGVRGFRIPPDFHAAAWPDSPGMRRMFTCAEEEGLAICPLLNPEDLPGLGRMCDRFPRTRVVIDHLARIGADGQVRERDVEALCALAAKPEVFVKVSAFYALGRKRYPYLDLLPLVRRVVDAFGPERLMWGSDSPFQVQGGHTYAGSLEFARERIDFLSPHGRDALLRDTAERVFFS